VASPCGLYGWGIVGNARLMHMIDPGTGCQPQWRVCCVGAGPSELHLTSAFVTSSPTYLYHPHLRTMRPLLHAGMSELDLTNDCLGISTLGRQQLLSMPYLTLPFAQA